MRGYTAPAARSCSVTIDATASAAAMNMGARTRVASARIRPMANPGKMYAEVDCRGATVRPSAREVKGCTGHPVANTQRPPVAAYACSAVHSLMVSGRDSAKMRGAAAFRPISSSTSRVKRRGGSPAMPPAFPRMMPSPTPSGPARAPFCRLCRCRRTPMSAVGLIARTASNTVWQSGVPSCAHGSLCRARSSSTSARARVTKPLESTNQIFLRASTTVILAVCAMCSAIISPMPVPVSPAPAIRYLWSPTVPPVFGSAAMMPASVMAATPCMSSLNVGA
mmetsp:Transcript_35614/g.89002  ORF Transcript_35614/g.89002 Transcript_35614/m.89002 type:complete len:280 (-) Transcript_35614:1057-1896(-)